MDEATIRNRIIEEQYPEGKVQNGFTFTYSRVNVPADTVALEVRLPDTTIRLFFTKKEFSDFVQAGDVVLRMITEKDN